MPDLVTVQYAQTGKSAQHNNMGMREMQARAFEKRNAQYLLIKAPPASGKSRALMFIALSKVQEQGMKKVIIAVPEMSIGGSFKDTDLTTYGFFADWHIDPQYNLCTPGNEGKVDAVKKFMKDPTAQFLVCTHATFRFAYEQINNAKVFDRTVVAIDEFHHTSAEEGNKLGFIVSDLIAHSTAHIVAMTGSYFRGDAVPILLPEDEAKFEQVTYTYYEQLNGYKYLKSLGIGYHFYQGRYFDAIKEVLDLNKKTIIHIPNVNSTESTGHKLNEVDQILDVIGTMEHRDEATGIYHMRTRDGKKLLVADLVTDNQERINVLQYLRNIKTGDEMDIIIALGMAKEGFDWPWCEHVLTVGYRSSLTEIIQIIGRATRDCEGKTHAQFTNLIAQPDAEDDDVKTAVNNMLKAITVSLLMEQVLAPNITFRPRSLVTNEEAAGGNVIIIDDNERPVTPRVQKILDDGGVNDILTTLTQNTKEIAPIITNQTDPELITREAVPKVVLRLFPELTPSEVETITEATLKQVVWNSQNEIDKIPPIPSGETPPIVIDRNDEDVDDEEKKIANKFVKVGEKFINIQDLTLDLIAQINPFLGAYEILSKTVNASMLKTIQDVVVSNRSEVSEEEALLLWPNIQEFKREHGRVPSLKSFDAYERRLAEVLAYVRNRRAQALSQKAQS